MMGGRWNPDVKLWDIQYMKSKGTELEKHLILDALEKRKIVTASNNICCMASYIRCRHIILDNTPENGRKRKYLIVYTSSAS